MDKNKFSIKNIPGWAVMLTIMGILYLTGLHTEAIGQVQRILLSTGIMKADVPTIDETTTSHLTGATSPAEANAPMVGAGFKMVDLNGKTVDFESLKGKVIFLNIWATWCPPCIAEMPNIHSLYKKMDPNKVAFVMLSVDEGGMAKVKKFIDKKGYTFPVYMPASEFPQAFYSNAIPTTFIISPAGKIMAKHEGMAEYDTKEVRDYLNGLAK